MQAPGSPANLYAQSLPPPSLDAGCANLGPPRRPSGQQCRIILHLRMKEKSGAGTHEKVGQRLDRWRHVQSVERWRKRVATLLR